MKPSAPRAWALATLATEGPLTVTVRGGSMSPLLVDGDRVTLVRRRLYLPGDVVAFEAPETGIVLHRLLGYRLYHGRLAAVMQGDAAARPDLPVPLGRLAGRLARPVPWGLRWRAVRSYLALILRRLARAVRREGP